MITAKNRFFAFLPLIFIVVLTAGLYANTLDNDLTRWDDNYYITENPRILDLSPAGITRIFNPWDIVGRKEAILTEYLPLVTLTHAVIYRFSGFNPAGYHAANLLFYLLDIILLYFFLDALFKDKKISFLATLAFSVHTAHVESVAWAAAAKDVLSFLFFILSFYAYVRFAEGGRGRSLYYGVSLFAFLLAMLSKSLVVTLPALLILHDLCLKKERLRLADKVPYFAIGIILSLLYMKVNRDVYGGGGEKYLAGQLSAYGLLLMDLRVLFEYAGSFFAPLNLSAYYDYSPADVPASLLDARAAISSLAAAAALAVAAASYLRGKRIITFCVAWFFIAFLPVLNIIPTSTLRADRYLFIPSVGASLLVGFAVRWIYGLSTAAARAVSVVFVVWVAFLSVLTVQRNAVWQNGLSLWDDAIRKNPESSRLHSLLGNEYRHRGSFDKATAEYDAALKLNPANMIACANLGALHGMAERYGEAISVLKQCLEYYPESKDARLNLAKAYMAVGEEGLAKKELAEVLRLDPDNAKARAMLEGI